MQMSGLNWPITASFTHDVERPMQHVPKNVAPGEYVFNFDHTVNVEHFGSLQDKI